MSLQKVLEYFKIVPMQEEQTATPLEEGKSNVVPFAPVEKVVDKVPDAVYNPKQFRR